MEIPVHATPLCIQEPAGEGLEAEIVIFEADSDYLGEYDSSSDEDPNSTECVMDTPTGRPQYILPAPLQIPRLEGVPCFHQQLDLDAMRISDLLCASIIDVYNIDEGVEFQVGHRLRNREAVHMAVKNYSIRRNAKYRFVESDRIKYHCRCKHASYDCSWSIRVALRENLGY
ncbi:hypothetical protein PIB30_020732 [Stylosanthes scabra]|uniref:Transposase MuDR plant domain-containing protein n=1 Tax=Stylosanthes scabra TaxID=79078 RepID=A0ABU6YAK6_9FABA|nr:hypothetical protein [Stylosanthes scabra]